VGSGSILRTTDGGATWTEQSTQSAVSVSCADANTCTAVTGDSAILRTTNGGATWTQQFSNASTRLYGISCSDANTCTCVGQNGTILRTTTGGEPVALRQLGR
jgi:photosystem II stability/assembly factor-like uncharacterized protein